MGSNYYAHWTPPGATSVTVRLHICKSMRSFSGLMFDSWAKWKDWLSYQAQDSRDGGGSIRILDEGGRPYEIADFIAQVEATRPTERARQTTYVQHHHPREAEWDWLDADGFSFHRGEFF